MVLNHWLAPCALLSVLAFFVPSAGAQPATDAPPATHPADPPQGQFQDVWMVILMQDQKIGHVHFEMHRDGDRILATQFMQFTMQRAGDALRISATEKSIESIKGEPQGFETEMNMASEPMRSTGTIADGRVTVVSEQFGSQTTQEIDFPTGARMAWGAYLEQLQHEVRPGQKVTYSLYSPSQALNAGIVTSIEVHELEAIEFAGQRMEAYRTTATAQLPNGATITTEGWIDDQWEPVKQRIEMMGLELVMVRCDRATALSESTPVEMFVDTLIPVGQAIDRDRVAMLRFRIRSRDGSAIPEIPTTAMQRVVERKDDELTLEVRRLDHRMLASLPAAAVPDELAEFLKPGPMISSADPAVVALARSAIEGAGSAYDRADRLRRKVSATVRYVGLGTGFASAAEVCRKKVGDCTENGVLLAALGRAVGIPSRVVTGLIYVPAVADRRDVLGFHMWSQVWVGGQWIDLDAAWDQTDCDPTHIVLGTHPVVDSSLVSGAMLKMNQLEIRVVGQEPRDPAR